MSDKDSIIEAEVVSEEESTDLAESQSVDIATVDPIADAIDKKIGEVIPRIFDGILDDKTRAEELYFELRELFLNGETNPDFLRELNKASENIQTSTSELVKVLDKLAKIKVGATRIQLAQLTQTKDKDGNGDWSEKKAQLIDIVEGMEEMND